jgi:hypothetical protein
MWVLQMVVMARMGALKSCPRCAEEVREEATMCRFCQYDFEPPPPNGAAVSRWVRSHPTLVVSLVTFLYVAFQIHKAAEFEVNTTVELIHAGGLTTVLIGVLLVQLPIELLLFTLVTAWWVIATTPVPEPAIRPATERKPTRSRPVPRLAGLAGDPRTPPKALLVALLVLSFYISPWPMFLLSAAVAAMAVTVAHRSGRGRVLGTRYARRAIGVLGAIALLILIQRPTIWVPAESVTTTDHGVIVGYVIAEDGQWTTLLTPRWTGRAQPGGGGVFRQATSRITARQPCAIDFLEARLFDRVVRLRPVQLLGAVPDGALPESLTPPCP